MQDKPVVGLYLDTRSASKKHEGKFPVKVRITFQVKGKWDVRYLGTKQYVTAEEFEVLEKGKAKTSALRDAQAQVFRIRNQAAGIVETNKRIGVDQFFYEYDKEYGGGTRAQNPQTVAAMFDEIVAEKNSADDIGTAITNTNAKSSLIAFGGKDLLVSAITPAWLREYESWMIDPPSETKRRPRSLNTVGFYLRALRSVCKRAVARHYLTEDTYPFGKNKYVIRKKKTKKRGLPDFVKTNILRYEPGCDQEAAAIDFSTFTFIAHGMNMTDIAYLRRERIHGDHFVFVRRKTRKTTLDVKEIRVPLSQPLRQILTRRGTHRTYVFGIITDDMDAVTKKKKINNWIGVTNDWLKKIAVKVGYTERISTYSWRHTFVSILINNNVPLTKVKDALGHELITTTQEYAEDLDLKTAKTFTDILLKP